MELIKSKGMIIFFVIIIGLNVISSINTKRFDEANKNLSNSYIAYKTK